MIDTFFFTIIALLAAVLLDMYLGEPKRWHPLVGFGYLALGYEKLTNQISLPSYLRFFTGMVGWLLLVIVVTIILIVVLRGIAHWSGLGVWFGLLLDSLVLYVAIGFTSLKQHAQAVWRALDNHDVELARQKVGMIVSRDTQSMDETAIRKATIESVLENGSDAIYAPIFWFMVGGVPAVIIYRLSNTLDAMWGYKTERFLFFGRFSARMDDILNWLPSRLVALTYSLLGNTRCAIRCWQQQAHLLESPSGGVVMAAGAGALKVSLGGSAMYHGELKHKPVFGEGGVPDNQAIERSLRLIEHTLFIWCALMTCAGFCLFLITLTH